MITRNLIVEDTETSGLDYEAGHEVVQICAKAFNHWDFAPHHAGTFHAFIKPQTPELAQAKAISIIGQENWTKACDEGLEPKVAWQQYYDWAASVNDTKKMKDKPLKFAHNKDFDQGFICHSLKKYKIVSKGDFGYDWPWGFSFDTMQVGHFLFGSNPDVFDLTLNTMLGQLGMTRADGKIHTAEEDVQLLSDWLIRCFKFARECNKRMRISK
jgi:DNA polymerase III alpha subunit (gram-positive type)